MSRRITRRKTQSTQSFTRPERRIKNAQWSPVSAQDVNKVAEAAFDILTTLGVANAPQEMIDIVLSAGGHLSAGRLCYPPDLLRDALNRSPRQVLLAGQSPQYDMTVGGHQSYIGTGGAAPNVRDINTGAIRASTLKDLYDAARLADRLSYVDFFARSLVAGDIENACDFDLATAAACLLGTAKHVIVQASDPSHVNEIANLCYQIAGSKEAFEARPFLSLHINHIVPPLRCHAESILVMIEAVKYGIPVHCNVFGQLGASSPVTLAGSVAQTVAETLVGLALVHALDPNAARIAGPRAMITDLRSGGMAGGSGEQALATALIAQVFRHWDIPCSVIAGATDSKLPDFQAGYEKALSVHAAIQAGAHLITQAIGSQAGLMAVDYAAMVADNDVAGVISRANSPIEITDDTLALASIAEVIKGDGHFLGQADTYSRMRSDFLYPEVADRSSIETWAEAGSLDMADRSHKRAKLLLDQHWPNHVPDPIFREIATRFGLTGQKEQE